MTNARAMFFWMREAVKRLACHFFGHRWVLATLDPVLWRPFNVCSRCGHVWSGPGEPL